MTDPNTPTPSTPGSNPDAGGEIPRKFAGRGAEPVDHTRRMATNALLVGGVGAALAAVGLSRRKASAGGPSTGRVFAVTPGGQAAGEKPRVEMVFALDTTGSMSSLLEGAKQKIWSLASFVARGQPTPDLRIGLVAYRDVGDAYVTQLFDLNDDLDAVYAQLRSYQADGGGDGPEHVARALHESVNNMSWSQDERVVRVVYLVGDAPPHEDYQDGYNLDQAARTAHDRGIQVHTIRCGGDHNTEVAWRRVAQLGRGEFLSIGQDGGMKEVATPYDRELARLHDDLTNTGMGYGHRAREIAAAQSRAISAAPEVKAGRASYMAAKNMAVGGKGDLVDDFARGKVSLESIPSAEMPSDLQGLPLVEQKARLHETMERRQVVLDHIEKLTKKREAHIASEADEGTGFDKVAKDALRRSVADNKKSGLKL